MMETPKKTNAEPEPAPKPRRWPRRMAIGTGLMVLAYLGYRIVFPFALDQWAENELPADAPNIAFSPNDTWLRELGINEAYKISITRAGGRLVPFHPEQTGADSARIEAWLEKNKIGGIILGGGGDVDPRLYGGNPEDSAEVNRQRDDFEITLIQAAVKKRLPILGICRGSQILNVARGGTLRNLDYNKTLADIHFNSDGHPVTLAEGSRLEKISKTQRLAIVGSYHRQAVMRLGRHLRITATGPGGVIEAIEGNAPGDPWLVAVQWHPELAVGNEQQQKLLHAFVREAKKK
ncbi:MAG: gamma-glutamyl-gamma-aminobutyrate hydrolase family protein [Verrucomicrobiales bacterium]|jgi:putative glutamine amidotransferase|nr:gamma-glutamyl-gamma-aminobutyrate hydrolase family protein [Verrucomicrobiales bacterium]MBT6450304.1 gamma-glutamyl-gamma-aminobutyrate hydrolase family protein [Verrucomicrobiales bacterium]